MKINIEREREREREMQEDGGGSGVLIEAHDEKCQTTKQMPIIRSNKEQ